MDCIARNILLITLLDDGEHTELAWNIFYHFKVDTQALDIIISQSQKLLDTAKDIETWSKSKYGPFIKFIDLHTLAELRHYWGCYAGFSNLPKGRINDLLKAQAQVSQSALGPDDLGANASLAAGLLWAQALTPIRSLFKRYWETGTLFARRDEAQAAKHLNPLFIYHSAGEKFNLHPATFPQGFHLAPALIPVVSDAKSAPALGTEESIAEVMKKQAESWGGAFRAARAAGAVTLRFFSGDALALCRALDVNNSTQRFATGVFASEWHAAQIDLYKPDANETPIPLSFDVIDTSNLAHHLGILNVLIATRPLLKNRPSSVLYTEDRSSIKESKMTKPMLNLFGTSTPTFSALLGIAPRVYLSGLVAHFEMHYMLSKEHVKRFRERMAWADPSGGDRFASRQSTVVSFEPDTLAQIVLDIYGRMFVREYEKVSAPSVEPELPFPYTRSTIGALLRLVRRYARLKGSSWDDFGNKFVQLIDREAHGVIGHRYDHDIYLQLQLHSIYTTPTLRSNWRGIRSPQPPSDIFRDLPNVPSVVCVVFTVPRKSLQPLIKNPDNAGVPILECHIGSNNSEPFAYASIYAVWGKCTIDSEGTKTVTLEEDKDGITGNSNLVVMFWAASHLLETKNTSISLALKRTSYSAGMFTHTLGENLALFKTSSNNREHVRILPYMPALTAEPSLTLDRIISPPKDSTPANDETSVWVNLGSGKHQRIISSLTARVDINQPAEQETLLKGAEVTTNQISPCTMDLSISKYRHTVIYPYPIKGNDNKLRVARKSHWIEIIVPVSSPPDNSGYCQDLAPVIYGETISPWNVHHINLDRMPRLKPGGRTDWLQTQVDIQHSLEEMNVMNRKNPTELAIPIYRLVNLKNSLREMTMYAFIGGIQGRKPRAFILLAASGGLYAVILIGGLCLDLASSSISLDAAFISGSTPELPNLNAANASFMIGDSIDIITNKFEALAWQKMLPVFAERCRTWSHNSNCEYATLGLIPLSTEQWQSPICDCGKGIGFKGPEWKDPRWQRVLPYATRVAICPFFAMQGDPTDSKKGEFACWVCGSSGESGMYGKPNLLRCGGCKKAKYCSKTCQQLDWKLHKVGCNKSA
ncbi:hypothetical protein FRC12_001912 [Ceratobasidium sp. 428]|nr:hypothetical protein FRC12_001912 [Ceratobasidium sp. 428]